jgi:hypothetical protein
MASVRGSKFKDFPCKVSRLRRSFSAIPPAPIKKSFLQHCLTVRDRRGAVIPPPIVETRRIIVNVVGNCQSCRRGEGEDLKCCRPKKVLVCRENFSVCRKSTALGPSKNVGPMAPLRDRLA